MAFRGRAWRHHAGMPRALPARVLSVPVVALVMAVAAGPLVAADPPAQGMDVANAAKAVGDLLSPHHGDKPWSDDLARLTSDNERVQNVGMHNLIVAGPPVLPDLAVLGRDRDWLLRSRVAQVAAGIGGEPPAALLIELSKDREPRVRAIAALGLGRARGPGVFERLAELLAAPETGIRGSAADALGALGDVRAIPLLASYDREPDDLVKRSEHDSLALVAAQVAAVPVLVQQLDVATRPALDAILEVCANIPDPRLCVPLVTIASAGMAGPEGTGPLTHEQYSAWLALRALRTCGDSRAWHELCTLAADAPRAEMRDAAAIAAHALTGYPANAGEAWTLWWRDHAAIAEKLMPRDAFFAAMHDPAAPIDRAALAAHSTDELMPLVDAVLGGGAPWWPARAYAILAADDVKRWTPPLVARIRASSYQMESLGLIVLLDQLGADAATLQKLSEDLEARWTKEDEQAKKDKHVLSDHGPERLALQVALERRNKN
jgi:HEAT repeat protein